MRGLGNRKQRKKGKEAEGFLSQERWPKLNIFNAKAQLEPSFCDRIPFNFLYISTTKTMIIHNPNELWL